MTPFQEWLEGHVGAVGQRGLAKKLGVDDSAIHSWLYRGILPTPGHETKLAEATGEPVEKIQGLVERSWRQQRAELAERRLRRRAGNSSRQFTDTSPILLPLAKSFALPRGAARLSRTAAPAAR